MHRHHAILFSSKPSRLSSNIDSIELDNFAELDFAVDEKTEDPQTKSYALEFALIPLEAAHQTVNESLSEAEEASYLHQSRLAYIVDCANTILAAPFAYCPAFVIAIFAFFGGAALDCYTAVMRHFPDEMTIEPEEQTTYLRTI